MISAKTGKDLKTEVHISGSNLMLFGELIAVVDSVSKAISKDDEEYHIAILAALPGMVLRSSSAERTSIELPCSLEKLKNLGGDNI